MLRFRMFAIACGYEDAAMLESQTVFEPGLWSQARAA